MEWSPVERIDVATNGLTVFSPARCSALPGLAFGGDPDRHPHRDEVVAYLLRYTEHLDADALTGHRAASARRAGRASSSTSTADRP
ncbi:hypothetical protein [Streptomyces filamentosus]|uniref:hypothetical protein n=1 Tax=Streptomyces filamentosus TaxID=67294 RepID=UPI00123B8783|nr:hypothetical protein [Streptomyces filamentosus]KAA6210215.1 hypothetical protein CP979_26840 [Streptomyces filamentosus]